MTVAGQSIANARGGEGGWVFHAVEAALLRQRGHLFPWVPVAMSVGIGGYFAMRIEPSLAMLPLIALASVSLGLVAWRLRSGWAYLFIVALLVLAGFGLAMVRAHLVAHPVLEWRYYGPVEGRVIGLDRSSSDKVRVTLDRVVLSRIPPAKTPDRIRVALHGQEGGAASTPAPGARVIVTANLSPPGGPVEPGGFDFQRHSWFLRLGGVGYARTPMLMLEPPDGALMLRLRMALSQRVQAVLPGETGAFAAAIMTGDRSGMGLGTIKALRTSNLAHLLAISGLHMGLLAGFVFAAVRVLLNLIPPLGLRLPVKKIAAVIALVAAMGYLALSGGSISTERAFVMVSVVLLAVVVDRRAISLRSVALAAVIVLILRPEALLGPGFQMSFAATVALVAVFRWLSGLPRYEGPALVRGAATVVISSAVAGAATAPFAAAHFNQLSEFGLVANLLSVPLMGVLVMPALVLAAMLMPFGLDWIGLQLAGSGLNWILGVAHLVAGWEGTRGAVPSPDWRVLPLLTIGALMVVLWQGRLRVIGVLPVAVAFGLWALTPRPDLLIADNGGLVGVLRPEGRALSKARGSGFVAQNWLENDGDPVDQTEAASRWQASGFPLRLRHVTGKKTVANLTCVPGEMIVANADGPEDLPCEVFDIKRLRQTGAVAGYFAKDGKLRLIFARELTGNRLWTR